METKINVLSHRIERKPIKVLVNNKMVDSVKMGEFRVEQLEVVLPNGYKYPMEREILINEIVPIAI